MSTHGYPHNYFYKRLKFLLEKEIFMWQESIAHIIGMYYGNMTQSTT